MFEWQEHFAISHFISNSGSWNNCYMFFLLYKQTDGGVFDDLPKTSNHFPKVPKIFQNCSEGQTNVAEHFPRISGNPEDVRRFPKIVEDCRLSRKTRRCFDDTPTILSTI